MYTPLAERTFFRIFKAFKNCTPMEKSKRKYTVGANELLKGIYKASQCCDINDVACAIDLCRKAIVTTNNHRGPTRSLYIRLLSLERKAAKFAKRGQVVTDPRFM